MASGKVDVLNPEYKTKPRVYYLGLSKHFIAGSVIYADVGEFAEGVSLALLDESTHKSTETSTNNFGYFESEGLGEGKYSVRFGCKGCRTKTLDLDLES